MLCIHSSKTWATDRKTWKLSLRTCSWASCSSSGYQGTRAHSFWRCCSWRQPRHEPLLSPPPRGGWRDPHPCSAARALQDQLPFRSQTNTVISLLSIPGWISRWAGSCGDVNEKPALSGALFSLQGVLPSRDEAGLFQLKVGVWKAYRNTRFLVSLGWGVQCRGSF